MSLSIRLFFVLCLLCTYSARGELIQLEDNRGRIINAELIESVDNYLTILRDDGRRYTFPMTLLNGRSQERVKRALTIVVVDPDAPEPVEPRVAPSNSLQLALSFNGPPPKEVSVNVFNSDTRKKEDLKIDPGASKLNWPDLKDGSHTVSFKADGYAYQWYRVQVRNGKVSPVKLTLDFRKKRYVIMRYAINLQGDPDLGVPDLYTGIAAFSDLSQGNPQHFLGWRIRQASPGDTLYGDELYLDWKWMVPGAGIQVRKEKFSRIQSAAGNKFTMAELALKPGLVFTCNSSYSRTKLYGKFEVVAVVDEPPADLEVY
jgi:hypothetical protein